MNANTPPELVESTIRIAKGHRVIFDFDLASLYGVTTFNLNKAVDRNIDRFPTDFMILIPVKEAESLLFQNGITKHRRGGRRAPFRAFTQEGVAMLSSVLNNRRAIQVNIEIMRTFVRLRSILSSHTDLLHRLNDLERRYDDQFRCVFEAIRDLMQPPDPPRSRIGFEP